MLTAQPEAHHSVCIPIEDHGSMEEWISRGEAALVTNHYDEAEKCFQRASRLNPFHPMPLSKLGTTYWQQSKIEDALNYLTRALELDPGHREAVMGCAEVLRSYGRTDDARMVLNAYLTNHPDDTEARMKLDDPAGTTGSRPNIELARVLNEQGEIQFNRGQTLRARVCFEMAIEADPTLSTAQCNLGVVSWQEGNLEAALDHLYKALDRSPEDPDVLHNCFQVLEAAGELETAADVLRFYLQKGFGDDASWDEYSRLQRTIGAPPWSSSDLTSEVADIYIKTGRALFEAGDRSGAITAFERAVQIGARDAEAFYQLGSLLIGAGDVEAGLELLKSSISIEPGHLEAARMIDNFANGSAHREPLQESKPA